MECIDRKRKAEWEWKSERVGGLLWRGLGGWGYPGPEPWRRLLRAEHSLNSWTGDKWEMTAKGRRMQGEETINILEAGRDVYYKKKEKARSVRELIMSNTIAARLCTKATVKMHLCLFLCWWNNYLCWLIYFKCCPFLKHICEFKQIKMILIQPPAFCCLYHSYTPVA